MFRNNYDNDSVTYSPTGRLFQVEYALEAIKQGSATVGVRSGDAVVLVGLKRNAEELGSYQKKLIKVDDHLVVGLAGLAPDARVLSNFLRQQAMNSKMVFDRPISVSKAAYTLADKAQENTQSYGNRPYGVGLLIAGVDDTSAHLYEFQPSGLVTEYNASAIGARSQAARTYLERNYETLDTTEDQEVIKFALLALRETLAQDKELTQQNTSVAIVSKGSKLRLYEDEQVQQFLDLLDSTANSRSRGNDDDNDDEKETGDDVKTEEPEAVTEPEPTVEGETGAAEGVASEDRMDTD